MSWAWICTGQGAQGPDLFENFPFSPEALALKQEVLRKGALAPDVADWLQSKNPDPHAITRNHFSQPLLCLYQQMVARSLVLPRPAFVAGYSLGELSAYGLAGALPPLDLIRLAGRRAALMDEASSGEMVVVTGCPLEAAEETARQVGGHTAIVLAEEHAVFGFPIGGSDAFFRILPPGAKAERLAVTVPAHTPLLSPAVEPFRELLRQIPWHPPTAPIPAGISSVKVHTRDLMLETLPAQIHQTIHWDRVINRMVADGCRVFLETGPGCQLSHSVLALHPEVQTRSVQEFQSPDGVRHWLEKCLATST